MTSYFHLASIGRRLVELDAGRELVRRGLERALGSHGPLAGILTDDQSRLDAFGRHAHHHADAELFHVLVEVLSVDLSTRAQALKRKRKRESDERKEGEQDAYIVPGAFECVDAAAACHLCAVNLATDRRE